MAKSKISPPQLLPEERVRQWFLGVLSSAGVEPYRVSVEYAVEVSGRKLRADIVIFERGTLNITTIVECKADTVKITSDTITQAAIYNTKLNAKYLIVTNGLSTYIYNTASRTFLSELPSDI